MESTVSVGAGRAGWRLGVVEAGVQHVGASAQNIRFTKAHIRKYTNTQIRKYTNTSGSQNCHAEILKYKVTHCFLIKKTLCFGTLQVKGVMIL